MNPFFSFVQSILPSTNHRSTHLTPENRARMPFVVDVRPLVEAAHDSHPAHHGRSKSQRFEQLISAELNVGKLRNLYLRQAVVPSSLSTAQAGIRQSDCCSTHHRVVPPPPFAPVAFAHGARCSFPAVAVPSPISSRHPAWNRQQRTSTCPC